MANMGINKVTLVGNLGGDPEIRHTSGGSTVCEMSIATNEPAGDGKTHTEWHRVVAWNKLAEICGQFLTKGRQVYVEGRLRTNKWEDKNGGRHQTTSIVATKVMFLGGNGKTTEANKKADSAAAESAPPVDAEIPF